MGPRQIPTNASPFRLSSSQLQIPPMNALEILRETVRILRCSPSSFMSILFLLICPVSAALLSGELVAAVRFLVAVLSRRLLILSSFSGLPLTHFIKQVDHHLASTLVSSILCFPLLLTLLLAARSAIAYSVACIYANKKVLASELSSLMHRISCRIAATYLWSCIAISGCFTALSGVTRGFGSVVCSKRMIPQPHPVDRLS